MQIDGGTHPFEGPKSLKQINERHRQFWLGQSVLRDKRMSDDAIFNLAMKDMRSEIARAVPVRSQKSFEQALEDAEGARSIVQSAFSRRGGKMPKSDALQDLIREVAFWDPGITVRQLLRELMRRQGEGVVVSIEGKCQTLAGEGRRIHFEDHNGTSKTAPVSGLKDRLSRAKKKITSR